ncbi:MAG: hypothetical protein ACE15F_17085 [bacterium]
MPTCINRPAWYLPALWLNPVITWGLLLSIFTFTPLTQKVLWLDTELDPRFGVLEEILRGQTSPYEIENPRIFVSVRQRDVVLSLPRERGWTGPESVFADRAALEPSSVGGKVNPVDAEEVDSSTGRSGDKASREHGVREGLVSRGHSPHDSN